MARKDESTKPYVFANANCAVATEHEFPVVLTRGDVWAADDPLVIRRPELFDAEPPAGTVRRTDLPEGATSWADVYNALPVPA